MIISSLKREETFSLSPNRVKAQTILSTGMSAARGDYKGNTDLEIRSNRQKNAIILILAFTAGVTVAYVVSPNLRITCLKITYLLYYRLGPMITTGFEEISKDFNVSLDQISSDLVGFMQMATGSGTFFTAAAAACWGKRPVFIVSTAILMATNAWGFFAKVSPTSIFGGYH